MKKKRFGLIDIEKKAKPIRKNGGRVKAVFNEAMSIVAKGETPDLNQIQRDEGYSEESIRCNKVFRTKTWEQMKGRDIEMFVKNGFLELASSDNDDKRTRTKNLENIATLTDMWPGKKMQIELLNEKNAEFFE
jgi:hypothetical protein